MNPNPQKAKPMNTKTITDPNFQTRDEKMETALEVIRALCRQDGGRYLNPSGLIELCEDALRKVPEYEFS
jgi:hypothetical protein